MHLLVLEAIPEVAVKGKEYTEPSIADNAEPARRAAIVLVNLGQAGGELVDLVEDRVVEREFDQLGVRDPAPAVLRP